MGTEVLRPQNSLTQTPAIFHHRKSYYGYGNGLPKVSSHRKPVNRSENRRKSSEKSSEKSPEQKRSVTENDLRFKQSRNMTNSTSNGFVVGQVTILRRGESLDSKIEANKEKNSGGITVYGTGRLGPNPKKVHKQVRFGLPDMYAGSAFSMSPAPSSLPLPSFFKKEGGVKAVDDSATKDLRRLLRLD